MRTSVQILHLLTRLLSMISVLMNFDAKIVKSYWGQVAPRWVTGSFVCAKTKTLALELSPSPAGRHQLVIQDSNSSSSYNYNNYNSNYKL